MMYGKTAMIAALAVGLSAATAGAQRGGMGQMGGQGMGQMRGQGMARGAGAAGGPGAMMERQMFRGITLSDAQKAQLETLRNSHRTVMQAEMKSAQADREALRTARQNGDTIALKAARRNIEGLRNRQIALRAQMQQTARNVLTPDQQKVFDSNRTRMEQRMERAQRTVRHERMQGRRLAMMRAMSPHRGWFAPGRGRFGPGRGMQRGGGVGPGANMQRGPGYGPPAGRGGPPPGAQPPDSSQAAPPIGG